MPARERRQPQSHTRAANSKDALDIAVTPQQRESLDGAGESGPQHSADLRSEHVESGRPTSAPAPTGRRRGDASSSDADAFAAPTPPLKRKPAQTPPGVRKKGVLWSDGVPSIRRSLKPSQLRSFRKPGPPVVARTLQAAIIEGSVERVETLLRSHPNALEWCECRHGHLHAAGAGRLHMLELLLRYGAPLASVDAAGQTALHLAVYEGQVACARALLDARAPCPEVVAEDDYGLTPVHLACERGDAALASLVLDRLRQSGLPRNKVEQLKANPKLRRLAEMHAEVLQLVDAWRADKQVLLSEL